MLVLDQHRADSLAPLSLEARVRKIGLYASTEHVNILDDCAAGHQIEIKVQTPVILKIGLPVIREVQHRTVYSNFSITADLFWTSSFFAALSNGSVPWPFPQRSGL